MHRIESEEKPFKKGVGSRVLIFRSGTKLCFPPDLTSLGGGRDFRVDGFVMGEESSEDSF